jgi:XisI protein
MWIDGKIWIQRDFTEAGIAQQLVDRGVPKPDIILSFRSPFVRKFSDFGLEAYDRTVIPKQFGKCDCILIESD